MQSNRLTSQITKIILIILLIATNQVKAEISREIMFDKIKVNEKIVDQTYSNEVLMSSKDSITFYYHLEVPEGAPKPPFLFRTALYFKKDSSVKNSGNRIIRYRNLKDGAYRFAVSGWGLKGNWTASPQTVAIRVDTKETELLAQIDELEDQKTELDSTLALVMMAKEKKESNVFDIYSVLLTSVIWIVGVGIVFAYITIVKRKKSNPEHDDNETAMGKDNASSVDNEQLLIENNNLKVEIAELRKQIDNMSAKGKEMQKRNREMEETLSNVSKSKKELEELQVQKDELFAVIIHDIKNPVSLIKSLVELLRSYDLTATEQQEIMDDIAETTVRIVSLSQEVSKILALESSTMHLEFDAYQVEDIVKDVYTRNLVAAERKSIKMINEYDENLPPAEIDLHKVDEVVDNLISNAIKFTQTSGTVRVKTSVLEKNILVEISDNGLGLSEEDIKSAFKRGSKLSAKPTGDESSSGLGLWIVKKLVEAHKGRVWVRSAVGKGSTFAFSIPMKHI